jgi:hypothetical protein
MERTRESSVCVREHGGHDPVREEQVLNGILERMLPAGREDVRHLLEGYKQETQGQ